MAMVTEFVAAVNQICSERGIDPESVFSALETAVSAAYKREYGLEEAEVTVEMDREDGSFKIVMKKTVVKDIENEDLEISLKEALKINESLEAGDIIEIEQHVEEFGRIAAQTAKQVIMQQIRESEKEAILAEYSNKVGEVFTAMMHRMQGGDAVFEIGKAMAIMPTEEQVSNEFYRIGDRYKILLKGIEDSARGKSLIVSRSAPEFLKELFRIEVPEIESEVVEVKACAREAGSRSKMAVVSHQEGVDAIGSCVGQRGVRIANVMAELGEEKIDIIEWREEIEDFVAKALSPAQVINVEVDDGVAVVEVEEDQLSLAIGKDGQNVRLAAKLTGLKIDIQGPGGAITSSSKDDYDDNEEVDETTTESKEENTEEASNSEIDGKLIAKLEKAGKSVEDVDGFAVEQLLELDGIGKVTAEKIFEALNS